MQSISVFLDIADFWWKNVDVSRTQGFFCPPPFFPSVSSPEKAHSE